MLATPVTSLPADPSGWAFEVKWDGVRIAVGLDGRGGWRLVTRNRREVARQYPELEVLTRLLKGRRLVLGGEIIALDPATGRPSFHRLQQWLSLRRPQATRAAMHTVPVTLVLFDVLADGDQDLTGPGCPVCSAAAVLSSCRAVSCSSGPTSTARSNISAAPRQATSATVWRGLRGAQSC
ncbi:hypothetical protein OG871_38785 [Kitasatospora sp. NBC_00374]|uniref:ATP-dependent DNA ligase n=1 Tax=Kitasatospora sp. NBC_00374 TaxID=2975964 RepID=UPI0030E1A8A6